MLGDGQTENIQLESTSFIIDNLDQESYRGDQYASNGDRETKRYFDV